MKASILLFYGGKDLARLVELGGMGSAMTKWDDLLALDGIFGNFVAENGAVVLGDCDRAQFGRYMRIQRTTVIPIWGS